ncbi:MAG: hypothetical protein CMJ49_10535 [Planctomycetaceae bacterium]|nr:hypothetical protein [Planctomycetaceae bacterium]
MGTVICLRDLRPLADGDRALTQGPDDAQGDDDGYDDYDWDAPPARLRLTALIPTKYAQAA